MKTIKYGLRTALLAMGVTLMHSVAATPIPNTTTLSSAILYNFDYTAVLPPSDFPLKDVGLFFITSGFTSGEKLLFDLYSDLNGVGLIVTGAFNGSVLTNLSTMLNTGGPTEDGVFSVGLRMEIGEADLVTDLFGGDLIQASSITAGDIRQNRNGVAATFQAVPEPTALSLIFLGLAGLGFCRRSKA